MVAPIDAKVTFEAGGESIALRLNFRSLSLLEAAGLDLFSQAGIAMTLGKTAIMCRCLAVNDHPAMTDDEALAIAARHGEAFGLAVLGLIAKFGGEGDEGNVAGASLAA